MTGYPIVTTYPIVPPSPADDFWATYAECGRVHQGPSHDRPTRPHDAGHERERDET